MIKIAIPFAALVLLLSVNTVSAVGTIGQFEGTISSHSPADMYADFQNVPAGLINVPVNDNLVGVVQTAVFTDVQQAYPGGWSPGVGTGIPSPPTMQIQPPALGGSLLPVLPDDPVASDLPGLMVGATHSVFSGGVGHVAGDLPGLVIGSPPNVLANYSGPTLIGN